VIRPIITALALLLAATPAFAQKPEDVEQKILDLTNAHRAKKEVGKLEIEDKLSATAQAHARAMAKADKYGDDDKNGHIWDGKNPADRAKDAAYKFRSLGENVGWNHNQKEPADTIVKAWIKSTHHEKNMTSDDFTQVGIGAAKGKSGKWYFVQLFGKPAGTVTRVNATIKNDTKETIRFRIGPKRYDLKAGGTTTVKHVLAGDKVQIAITWPDSVKPELADLADKSSYALTQNGKKYEFKKAESK
jgi:hypothetical protein